MAAFPSIQPTLTPFSLPSNRPDSDTKPAAFPLSSPSNQPTPSPLSPPSIVLPKGGGAIRNMGEKFTVNPLMGTSSLTIPIAVTPGRSGFGPTLSLTYDSGAGNGPFGFGWRLSLPAITRKTDKGLPQYQDSNESDVFILSDAEDLVPVLIGDARDSHLRVIANISYSIQRYRPRIEGSFMRIEQWTNLQTGDIHWRTISRDNVTTLYGVDNNSRIFDPSPEHPTRVFSWLICESRDSKGNVIVYQHKAEDSDGVELFQAHESNRTSTSRSANRYLKRIKYGNRVPSLADGDLAQAEWLFEVVLDYGEHSPDNPTSNDTGSWLCRHDPFSSYRSGFEIRSYRLCQRVLMFHHFPAERNVGADCLVRSTAFTYRSTRNNPEDERKGHPIASFISSVIQSGFSRLTSGGYVKQSLPPLEFKYNDVRISSEVRDVDPTSLENLPAGVNETDYRWVDLDGEGITGIMTEQAGEWFYKRNQSPLNTVRGDHAALYAAKFGPVEIVSPRPTMSLNNAQFLDLAGDGQLDVVQFSGVVPGFYERTQDGQWRPFTPFRSLPNINWNDANLRLIDLDGDGFADVLITEHDALTWYSSLMEEGFGLGHRTGKSWDEEHGPAVVFADGEQSIHLADMSGDGLNDLVRIRNTEICYWPNIGYGRFGAKVAMDNAPRFDYPDQFSNKRIRLADIDGSGTTDIIYVSSDGVDVYINEAGNGWMPPVHLANFPRIDDVSTVVVIDLLGNGTMSLVWSSPLPGDSRRQMHYIDLMGGSKPHLLVKIVNNVGSETHLHYAPSTRFYLQDKQAGNPWITRLPFPVHVVERLETFDHISRNIFTSQYTYHHGHFDSVEREFRGFGMVEQLNTEEITTLHAPDQAPLSNVDEASHVPPMLTKTWVHTGASIIDGDVSRQFEREYFRESGLTDWQLHSMTLEDTVLPNSVRHADGTLRPHMLSIQELREASRSLKGSILRQEIYSLDGTEEQSRPYSVSERNFTVELLQPLGLTNRHAVVFSHPRETINFHYERALFQSAGGHMLADPRVTHTMVLAADNFGNVLKSVAIGYGRRHADPSALLTQADHDKQKRTLITYTESHYSNSIQDDDNYLAPLQCEMLVYELLKVVSDSNDPLITNLFRLDDLLNQIQSADSGLYDLPHEDINGNGATQNHLYRRILKRSRILYRSDDMSRLLPLGQLEARALPGESYNLALTPGLIKGTFKRTKPDQRVVELLPDAAGVLGGPEGGYIDVDHDGHWWVPDGRLYFHADSNATPAQELTLAISSFFRPRRHTDALGHGGIVEYDNYMLLTAVTVDALDNRVESINDYRVLQPRLVTDPNGNRGEVAFDALGLVVGTAVMGKAAENVGDSLSGFLTDLTQQEIDDFFADPRGPVAVTLLRDATSRVIYDIGRYWREPDPKKKGPAFTATISREAHASEPLPESGVMVQVNFSYSDGFEREIQRKGPVESGSLTDGGPVVNSRWVCSGWTVYNNKGMPIRQYEPFFDDTHHFRFDSRVGVSPIVFYDPLERAVGHVNPDHTWDKVVFDPWQQRAYDVNDTVIADPKADPDVGQYFRRLPDADYLPTWHVARITGGKGPDEKAAAMKTQLHSNTPTTMYLDSLGRTFLTVVDNGTGGEFTSRVLYDIQGNQLQLEDSQDRIVARYKHDMLRNRLHQASMEAGERWMLNNAVNKRLFDWNSRGFRVRSAYDELQRPTETYLQEDGITAELLVQRMVYGEMQTTPDPRTLNQRQRVVQIFDQAGVVTNDEYDFKGNLLHGQRQFAKEYKTTLDWAAGTLPVEEQSYTFSMTFDALNRVVKLVSPDNTTLQPTYNEATLLEAITANLRGEKLADGQLVWTSFVTSIDYDAKGRRKNITYGNGTNTKHTFDPNNFRLVRLETLMSGSSDHLQDLNYTYDPAGNITSARDDAQQTIFFRNNRVEPSAEYTYDAVYRLIEAIGREHLGQTGGRPNQPTAPGAFDLFHTGLDHPGNGQAMGTYVETYNYDSVGNILSVKHRGSDPAHCGWTRFYTYEEPSQLEPGARNNRLSSTTTGSRTELYKYDGNVGLHGIVTAMPQLKFMQWDYRDQLRASTRQIVNGDGSAIPEITYYVYNAGGQRIRKVTERQASAGAAVSRMKERIYLGHFEIYREFGSDGTTVSLERETIHVMDDQRRIATVESRTHGTNRSPQRLIRYQYSNLLNSACLELDDTAKVLSYEEYYPYGSTSYQAMSNLIQVPKRYRYIGKERDEESGLDYHGARYYASWIGRWISADPGGLVDGPNLFWYAQCNPIAMADGSGFQADDLVNPTVVKRGKYTGQESQADIAKDYAAIGIHYRGNATWKEDRHTWFVDRKNLISDEPPAGKKDSKSGAGTEPPSGAGSGTTLPAEKAPGVAESFAWGLLKGVAGGFAGGLLVGAMIASGGTLALLGAGIALGGAFMGGMTLGKFITGKDLEGKELSAGQRAEMVGELLGGILGGAAAGGVLSAGRTNPPVETGPAEVGMPKPSAPTPPPEQPSVTIEGSGKMPSPPPTHSQVPLPNPGESPMPYGTRVHPELPRIVGETNPGADGRYNVAPGLRGPDLQNPTGINAKFVEMKSIWGRPGPMRTQAHKWGFELQEGRYFFYDRHTGFVLEGVFTD